MAAAEQVDDEQADALTAEELVELKKLVTEFRELREYVPVLRALKGLMSTAPAVGTPKSTRPARPQLSAEEQAEVRAKVDKALKRQELKR